MLDAIQQLQERPGMEDDNDSMSDSEDGFEEIGSRIQGKLENYVNMMQMRTEEYIRMENSIVSNRC